MKKMLSLLLALVLVLSMIPMAASAASWFDYEKIEINPDNPTGNAPYIGTKYDGTTEKISYKTYEKLEAQYKAWLVSQEEKLAAANHDPNDHSFGWASNTKYHWMACPCGCEINKEPHIDPKDAENDYCYCGYHFSSNADLVTLWVKDCPAIGFKKDKTEYETNAYTYKDVKEIKIATRTHDSEATVELPEDLTLKEGKNVFEVKVTAENQKVTKVYTIVVNKEAK